MSLSFLSNPSVSQQSNQNGRALRLFARSRRHPVRDIPFLAALVAASLVAGVAAARLSAAAMRWALYSALTLEW